MKGRSEPISEKQAGGRRSSQEPSPPVRKTGGGFLILCVLISSLWGAQAKASLLQVTDEVGRKIAFPFPPKRIISLAPHVTETLFAVGIDEQLVGVSVHCNYPERAKTKTHVGTYIKIDLEKIVSLSHPDLVIATAVGNTRQMIERLDKVGIPAYVVFPKNLEGILETILHIGTVVDREKEAAELVQAMKRRMETVAASIRGLPRPTVFIQIGNTPLVTAGKGSFADDLIRLAGGRNIMGDRNEMYPRVSMEAVVKKAPEVILITSMNPGEDYRDVVGGWARWMTVPAVKNSRVHVINSDLVDRPSPRIISGLEEMAIRIHGGPLQK